MQVVIWFFGLLTAICLLRILLILIWSQVSILVLMGIGRKLLQARSLMMDEPRLRLVDRVAYRKTMRLMIPLSNSKGHYVSQIIYNLCVPELLLTLGLQSLKRSVLCLLLGVTNSHTVSWSSIYNLRRFMRIHRSVKLTANDSNRRLLSNIALTQNPFAHFLRRQRYFVDIELRIHVLRKSRWLASIFIAIYRKKNSNKSKLI